MCPKLRVSSRPCRRTAAIKRLALISVAAVLAACQPTSQTEEAPADAPAVTTGPWEITASGVGPITADTPFDAAAIQALFSGSTAESGFLHVGEETIPIITVYGSDDLSLEIQGSSDGRVARVSIGGGAFAGPNGETLLTPWPQLGLTPADCAMGEGRRFECHKADAANVSYVIAVPGWDSDAAPDEATLTERAILGSMGWIRP